MRDTYVFKVTLISSEPFECSNAQKEEMVFKLIHALQREIDSGAGLMPDDSECYTQSITVSNMIYGGGCK